MGMQWLVVAHVLATGLVVVSFLCGHWPIFQGTFIERFHNFLTFGAYDYLIRFVFAICGSRGRNIVLGIEHYCCERPNPILQLFYLSLIGITYAIIVKSTFKYVPGYYVSEIHRPFSVLAVGVGIVLFALTSFSDPGYITSKNVSQYLAAYPYDNIIYVQKECSTCKITRPARSKHCRICGKCVARFDHHCGWMNNCIGEKNTRYFVAFLLWHFLLCLYGAIVIGFLLAGQLKQRGVIYILTAYYGVERSFSGLFPHVVQWLVSSFNTQILLTLFLAIVSLLLAGFFGYHAHLCLTNVTTNETFKWQDYASVQRKVNEAKATAAALKSSVNSVNDGSAKSPGSKWRSFCRGTVVQNQEDSAVKRNLYDRGMFSNLSEIIIPFSERRSFVRQKPE